MPTYQEGFYVVDKPLGISSQRAVQFVKYWARHHSGDKKIKVGHAGTLDPLASGVLVVAVGRSFTREIDDIVSAEKEYIADLTFGAYSVTDDAEGEKEVVTDHPNVRRADVENVCGTFEGVITQVPPVYSAIKVNGQEAYKRTRKGQVIEMQPREVVVHEIEVLAHTADSAQIRVCCGKGVYIRSLARDIGAALGVGCYLSGLRRTRVGDYDLSQAYSVDDFAFTRTTQEEKI